MIYKDNLTKGLTWGLVIFGLSNIYLSPAFAQSGMYGNGHMGRWMGGWGMGWFGMIFMLLFWGVIIAGIIFLIRWLIQKTGSKSNNNVNTDSQAMDILKERYARGEITRDEFESMKKEILR